MIWKALSLPKQDREMLLKRLISDNSSYTKHWSDFYFLEKKKSDNDYNNNFASNKDPTAIVVCCTLHMKKGEATNLWKLGTILFMNDKTIYLYIYIQLHMLNFKNIIYKAFLIKI